MSMQGNRPVQDDDVQGRKAISDTLGVISAVVMIILQVVGIANGDSAWLTAFIWIAYAVGYVSTIEEPRKRVRRVQALIFFMWFVTSEIVWLSLIISIVFGVYNAATLISSIGAWQEDETENL